jgi:hypothetical protein
MKPKQLGNWDLFITPVSPPTRDERALFDRRQDGDALMAALASNVSQYALVFMFLDFFSAKELFR